MSEERTKEIETMEAGPQVDLKALDGKVAERVFGFRWFHCVAGTGVERNQFCSPEQAETWKQLGWKLTAISSPPPPDQFNDDSGTPDYSTFIAAAMEVIEKMRADKWIPTMVTVGPKWMVQLFRAGKAPQFNMRAHGESTELPEAICLAALKATECLSIHDHTNEGQA